MAKYIGSPCQLSCQTKQEHLRNPALSQVRGLVYPLCGLGQGII